MDFNLSSDQELIKNTARKFLEKECPKVRVRELMADEKGYDPEVWRQMAELGWMGLALAEEYGGFGGGLLDLALVFEEMGRALLPSPFFLTTVSALAITAFGNAEQKDKYLPPLAEGKSLWSLALTEADGSNDPSDIRLSARAEGENFVLDGTKLFVPYGHEADSFLVVARTNPGDGLTIFTVDAATPGIEKKKLPTTARDQQWEIYFSQVRIPGGNILGEVDQGGSVLDFILEKMALLKSAEILGGTQAVLEVTNAYAKERVQFGAVIGSFQAVQHNLVDLFNDLQGYRHLVYEAAWRSDSGLPQLPDASLISMAKARGNQLYEKACIDCLKLHGAMGFTEELDLGLYHLKTRAWIEEGGNTRFHLERIVGNWVAE
jgi:alkylation response protein AidB-like acyl-CoA dehydrogenase